MAITRAKLTIFFGCVAGPKVPPTGWTETWYAAESEFPALLKMAEGYIAVRKELLGFNAFVQGARVSDDGNVDGEGKAIRDTKISSLSGVKDSTSSIYTTTQDSYDPTQVDLLVRVEATELYRRSWWVGGLPDSQTLTLREGGIDPVYVLGSPWTRLIKFMLANRFGIRRKNPAGPRGYSVVAITDLIPRMVRNRKRGRPFDLFHGRRL